MISRTCNTNTKESPMRKECYDCCLKHMGTALAVDGLAAPYVNRVDFKSPLHATAFLYLSKALVLRDEVYQGYPIHENYVRGYLGLASHVLITDDPAASDAIRLFRLGLQDGIGAWNSMTFDEVLCMCMTDDWRFSSRPSAQMSFALIVGNISEASDEIMGYSPETAAELLGVVQRLLKDPATVIRADLETLCETVQALKLMHLAEENAVNPLP